MARRGVGETRKHLARAERERRQTRWIMTGAIAVAAVLIVVLGYGFYDTTFIKPYEAVAVVNGNTITASEFEGRVRLIQRELLNQLSSYLQMESFFGSDPDILQQLRNAELQIQTQLANPEVLGQDVLDSMILQQLLINEAERQGVAVGAVELENEVQRNFNYYPEGTPTSAPTLTPLATETLDPTNAAGMTPTTSASSDPTPTGLPTSIPQPTSTPYTQEAYEQDYQVFIKSLDDFRIKEKDFLSYLEVGILEAKMRQEYVPDVDREEEQVFAKVILAESEEIANDLLARLEAGEAWEDLALEYSLDESTRANGGEVGWMTVSEMIARYGQPGLAAFAAADGEVVGPFTVEAGAAFLFIVEQREVRPMSEQAYQSALNRAFDNWLQGLRDEADVTISEDWQQFLPPAVPLSQ